MVRFRVWTRMTSVQTCLYTFFLGNPLLSAIWLEDGKKGEVSVWGTSHCLGLSVSLMDKARLRGQPRLSVCEAAGSNLTPRCALSSASTHPTFPTPALTYLSHVPRTWGLLQQQALQRLRKGFIFIPLKSLQRALSEL